MGRSRRRQRKAELKRRLLARDLPALREQAVRDSSLVSTLVSFLLEPDDLLRWRAIEGLAEVAAVIAADDLDRVRDLVRRQFWSMNDESGGVAWHAPETVGAILTRVPQLAGQFARPLASMAHVSPYEPGALWSAARLAAVSPALLDDMEQDLAPYLGHDNPMVRGHAAAALRRLDPAPEIAARIDAMTGDDAAVTTYDFDSGELRTVTVGELAA